MHLLSFLAVMGKLKPLGGWCGFTWDRIDSMLEVGCLLLSALSVQHNDDFYIDEDDDADDMLLHGSSEAEGLGWFSEGCVSVGSDSNSNAPVGLVLLHLARHDEGLKMSLFMLPLLLHLTCP